MAEITTGSTVNVATAPAPAPSPAPAPAPAPAASTIATKAQAIENTVFAFIQAHYGKIIAVAIGYAAAHFGWIAGILAKL
jgi:hypothetical protein